MPIAGTKNQNCQGSRARAKFLSSFTLISGLFVNLYDQFMCLDMYYLEFFIIVLTFPQLCLYLCLFVPQVACLKLFAGLLWHIHDPFFINTVLSNCGSKGWWTSLPSIHAHFIAIAHPYSAARMAYPFHTGFNWSFSFPILLNIPL